MVPKDILIIIVIRLMENDLLYFDYNFESKETHRQNIPLSKRRLLQRTSCFNSSQSIVFDTPPG